MAAHLKIKIKIVDEHFNAKSLLPSFQDTNDFVSQGTKPPHCWGHFPAQEPLG